MVTVGLRLTIDEVVVSARRENDKSSSLPIIFTSEWQLVDVLGRSLDRWHWVPVHVDKIQSLDEEAAFKISSGPCETGWSSLQYGPR